MYSKQSGLTFREVERTKAAQLVFMFIKGEHADGTNFHGAGGSNSAFLKTGSQLIMLNTQYSHGIIIPVLIAADSDEFLTKN